MAYEIATRPSDLCRRRRYTSRVAAEVAARDIARAYGETLEAVDVVNLASGAVVYSLRRGPGRDWRKVEG